MMLVKKYSKSDLSKFLKPSEVTFLSNLNYWINNKTDYGVQKLEKKWIYNTLAQWAKQTQLSKISVRRAIENLKKQGIISSAYLSYNKRNRTLFYSINYQNLDEIVNGFKSSSLREKYKNEHMDEHMYIDNNNNFNKSYKSIKTLSQKKLEDKNLDNCIVVETQKHEDTNSGKQITEKPKNTTVQDMVRIFNEEFSDVSVQLDKNLARNMVAAFKLKFENSIQKWKSFLKLIKTSNYLMGEKFKLTLRWLLKFSTIDRLNLGELGVKICNKFSNKIDDEELQSRVEQQISEKYEPEILKEIRRKISEKISPAMYLAWFANVDFKQEDGTIRAIYPSRFVEDTIKIRFIENFKYINISL